MNIPPTAVSILTGDNGPRILSWLNPAELADSYLVAGFFSHPPDNRAQQLPQRGARFAIAAFAEKHNVPPEPEYPRDDSITSYGHVFCHSGRFKYGVNTTPYYNKLDHTWARHIPWDKFCRGYVIRESEDDPEAHCEDCQWGMDRIVRHAQCKTNWSWQLHLDYANDFP